MMIILTLEPYQWIGKWDIVDIATTCVMVTSLDGGFCQSDFTPKHQPENMDKWVYPSEQQYFNAMKVGGGLVVEEGDSGG